MIFSMMGCTGMDLSRPPFPWTWSRISPGLPASEWAVSVRISADRSPATSPKAMTRTSRSGQGSLAWRAPLAAAVRSRVCLHPAAVSEPGEGL